MIALRNMLDALREKDETAYRAALAALAAAPMPEYTSHEPRLRSWLLRIAHIVRGSNELREVREVLVEAGYLVPLYRVNDRGDA